MLRHGCVGSTLLTVMNTQAILYGFDGRQPLTSAALDWTTDRREIYLLRKEIQRPISVDRRVWPPVEPAQTPSVGAFDYWTDLSALRQALRMAEFNKHTVSLVALVVCTMDEAANALLMPCDPPFIDKGWRSLGYDIADNGLISGLSNCGFLKEEGDDVEEFRREFGPNLNDYGLFDRFDDADEFRIWSNKRMPEHCPFLVHELFEILN